MAAKKKKKNPHGEVRTKYMLDRRVAELLGRKVAEVSGVTEAFLHEISSTLVDGDEVRLDGLGTISICAMQMKKPTVLTGVKRSDGTRDTGIVQVRRKYYVRFRKSTRLREAIWARHGRLKARRVEMDKYGVDESTDGEDLEKKAAEGCPICGKKPTKHGNTLLCPVHGSEPFEKKQQ